jgi:hypothetical protein
MLYNLQSKHLWFLGKICSGIDANSMVVAPKSPESMSESQAFASQGALRKCEAFWIPGTSAKSEYLERVLRKIGSLIRN